MYTQEQQRSLSQKIQNNQFNLEDLLKQIQKIKKMGNLKEIVGMLPGMGKALQDASLDNDIFKNCEVIINSMKPKERKKPEIIDRKCRERIALGSGTTIQEVNQLLKQFGVICKLMQKNQKGGFNFLSKKPTFNRS